MGGLSARWGVLIDRRCGARSDTHVAKGFREAEDDYARGYEPAPGVRLLRPLSGREGSVRSVRSTSDGRVLATGGIVE
jgi:hypothetical protein